MIPAMMESPKPKKNPGGANAARPFTTATSNFVTASGVAG